MRAFGDPAGIDTEYAINPSTTPKMHIPINTNVSKMRLRDLEVNVELVRRVAVVFTN